MKNGNFVAKFDHLVNKAKTFKDRKKAFKKGYMKHKNKFKGDYVPFCIIFLLKFFLTLKQVFQSFALTE